MAYLEFGKNFWVSHAAFYNTMSFRILKSRRGQGSMIEYAVLFFIVIAAITAMSTYAKRGVQARVRSARNYMGIQVNGVYGNMYPNRVLPLEYEPYYVDTDSEKVEQTISSVIQTPWTNHEGKFETGIASSATSQTTSTVTPAINAY